MGSYLEMNLIDSGGRFAESLRWCLSGIYAS